MYVTGLRGLARLGEAGSWEKRENARSSTTQSALSYITFGPYCQSVYATLLAPSH